MTVITNTFPWLNGTSVTGCFQGLAGYTAKIPLHEFAKIAMEKYKDKPARTELELKRCEEIIQHYDPEGALSEYNFCKVHEKCLKSHGCESL